MKKLLKDDSNDFPSGKILSSLFVFFFFPLTAPSAQSQLNNFGITEFVKTHSGYPKFTLVDFNNDGIKDLFLFGKQEKSFVIHQGLKDSTFSEPIKKFFFYPIDDFKWLTKSKEGDDYYIFVSRNKRLTGIVSFTNNYSLQLLNTIKFNSYPSVIAIVDFNKNKKNEALIFGYNFNGIEIVSNNGYLLKSESLISQNVFSDIAILDFNQDELDDIITIDLLNNKLLFYENSDLDELYFNREIEFDETISSIEKINYNDDSFYDLALSKDGGIEIFLGDSVYSFFNSINFQLQLTTDKFIIDDLNSDMKQDLVYSNKIDNQIHFVSNFSSENKEIKYELNGITDLKILSKNKTKSLLALSKKGVIQKISNKSKWGKNFSFTIGGLPNKISVFKQNNTNLFNLLIDNKIENSIEIIEVNSNGIFNKKGSVSFLNTFESFSFTSDLLNFASFTRESRLLEILNTNENKTEQNQNFHYTKYPVEQFLFNSNGELQILEFDNDKLYYESIINSGINYNSDTLIYIDSSVVSAKINIRKNIIYWKRDQNQLNLYKYFNGNISKLQSVFEKNPLKYQTLILKDETDIKNEFISLINNGKDEKIFLINNDKVTKYIKNSEFNIYDKTEQQSFKFYSSDFSDKILLNHQPTKSRIRMFKFNTSDNSITLFKVISSIKCNDYYVFKYFGKNYIVYSNNENNSITFRVIE